MARFDETEHPRGREGRFADKPRPTVDPKLKASLRVQAHPGAATRLEDQEPGEIDTVLAELWGRRQAAAARLASSRSTLERVEANPRFPEDHKTRFRNRVQPEIDRYSAEVEALDTEADPYETEYRRRGGWRRYFLVNEPTGHVHRERSCPTCRPTTSFSWLPELSGGDEEDMVAEWGEKACTTCFPDAPTKPGWGNSTWDRAQADKKAAADADKAARAAAKAEKGITGVDGKPLRDERGDVIKTLVTARQRLTDLAGAEVFPGHPASISQVSSNVAKRSEARRSILEAIVAKTGEDPDDLWAAATLKAKKRGY